MFLSVSGFLVAQSLEKSGSVSKYIINRIIRVFPALAVVVALSALVLGPLYSNLSFKEYFLHPEFWAYWSNLWGQIRNSLPGVFTDNPWVGVVNASLWTIPIELACYFLLAAFAIFEKKIRVFVIISLILLTIIYSCSDVVAYGYIRQPGSLLFVSFLSGVLIYKLRQRIILSANLALFALLLIALLLPFYETLYIALIPLAYLAVYLGLKNPTRLIFVRNVDFSYGIYLFASPAQQALVAVAPDHYRLFAAFLGAGVITIFCAVLSWHLIERPLHQRRDKIHRAYCKLLSRAYQTVSSYPIARVLTANRKCKFTADNESNF